MKHSLTGILIFLLHLTTDGGEKDVHAPEHTMTQVQIELHGPKQLSKSDHVDPENPSTSKEASVHQHALWNKVLQKYVSAKGNVDYAGIKNDQVDLDKYLELLSKNPVEDSWTRVQQLAYWINAYNAFTVKLIIDNYPLESIRDIQRPWGQKFIKLGNKMYSLNQIEHEIIRPDFKEPRIHFAVVCAAVSCPKLLNEAYLSETLEQQLEAQTRYFINDSGKNDLSPNQVKISQLFNWYGRDFKTRGSIIDFLNMYADLKVSERAEIEFLKYDWSLNDSH